MTERFSRIIDAGQFRQFQIQLPAVITHLNLSPFAGWLYTHLKASQLTDNQDCSEPGLVKACNMTVNQVRQAKKELAEAGLIRIDKRTGRDKDIITLLDIQPLNFTFVLKRQELLDNESKISLSVTGPLFDTEAFPELDQHPAIQALAQELPIHGTNNIIDNNNIHDSDLFHKSEYAKQGNGSKQPEENSDLKGESAWKLLWGSVMRACGLSQARLQGRDTKEIANCIKSLQKDNPGVPGTTLAKRIEAFSIWWRHREINGQKLGWPSPSTIVKHWHQFVTWCRNNLEGYLPTEDTFKDGRLKA